MKRARLGIEGAFTLVALLTFLSPGAFAAGGVTPFTSKDQNVQHASSAPACTSPANTGTAPVADGAAPHGVFVLAGSQPLSRSLPGQSIQKYLLTNPDVCGATVFVNWPLVDRGPGAKPRYNWNVINQFIAPWSRAGKIVNLLLNNSGYQGRVLQGVPQWLQPQLQTVTCGNSTAPVYWDPAFVSAWQGYVAAVVRHYAKNPNIGYLHVGVGTGAQTLVVGVRNPPCLASWNAVGYSTQWPAYVSRMISFAAGLHSPKQLIVSFNDYSNTPPASTIIRQDAAGDIGFGFSGLQSSDAREYAAGQPCGKTDWCALYDQYAGKAPAFVQTLGQSYPGPEVGTSLMPSLQAAQATGPLPPLLETALDVHTQIFEIYSADLLLAFDPSSPGYAQDHAAYMQAFANVVAVVGTAGGMPAATN